MPDDFSADETTSLQHALAPDNVASPTRRRLLAQSTLGLAAGAALALAAVPAHALSHPDQQALRFLEEVEALQSDFFTRAALSIAVDGMEGRERSVINLIANQDREQYAWFRMARQKMGVAEFGHFYTPNTSTSRPPRMFTFAPDAFGARAGLLAQAISLKETAVDAYHGVVARTDEPKITQAIAALAGIESRHAAALREINGENPVPEALEGAQTPTSVLNRLMSYGFRGESLR